MFSIVNNLRVE